MRKLLFQIRIAALTFILGLAAVAAYKDFSSELTYAYEVFVAPPGPRFMPYGRGCGNGYVQSYETNEGQYVAEGVTVFSSRKEARKEFAELKRKAVTVYESVPNYRDHERKVGERLVAEWVSDDGSKRGVSILFYKGDDSYRFVDAPSLATALEFEQFLIDIDYRSQF